MHSRTTIVMTLVVVMCAGSLSACLWDHDTLKMERARFPHVLELITGKFLRHSREFYEWRAADREKRLKESDDAPAEVYDDLAVAYDKLGRQDEAIDIMKRKETLFPGKYETRANLGTFLIHSGQLEAGVVEIDEAITINPDAHFGREIYQSLLVRYVLAMKESRQATGPLDSADRREIAPVGFAQFVLKQRLGEDFQWGTDESDGEVRDAVKGVSGMMRFGHFDSPVLLEALGDLLRSTSQSGDAKQLAARAYLKASYEVGDEPAANEFRRMASESLSMQTKPGHATTEMPLSELEATFKKELEDASSWYDKVRADELSWIESGANPEEEFDAKYFEAPSVDSPGLSLSQRLRQTGRGISIRELGVAGLAVFAVITFVAVRVLRRPKPNGRHDWP